MNTYRDYLLESIEENLRADKSLEKRIDLINDIADEIVNCYAHGRKLLIFGNGGSAADAQHIAGELVGRFKMERSALPAIALTTDTSIITAWSNDYQFGTVFQRQVEALALKGDILWGLSTSGSSENVLNAFRKGREIGTYNISFTGDGGGALKVLSDICFEASSKNTPRIQENHQLAYHLICDLVEKKIYGGKNK